MTLQTLPVPSPRAWRRLAAGSFRAEPWASALPRADADALRAAELGRRLRRRVDALPPELPERLARALAEVFPAEHRPRPRLEATLVQPDGERRKLRLERPRTVLGRDAGCDLRLPSPAVAPRQCELRLSPTGAGLLALAPGLSVDGTAVDSDRLRPLAAGSVVDLPPYRLVVVGFDGEAEAAPARVAVRSVACLSAGGSPERDLASLAPGAAWLDLRFGDWHGLAAVPAAWPELAARVLGVPGPDARAPLDDLDRALLAHLLGRAGRRLGELTGVEAVVRGPFPAARAEALARRHDEGRAWAAARVDLALAGLDAETVVLWSEPAEAAPPPGLDALPVRVAVAAGFTVLPAADLRGLVPGDVVLPDRWWPGGDPFAPIASEGEGDEGAEPAPRTVRLRLDTPGRTTGLLGHCLDAHLRAGDDGRFHLEITSPWRPERPEDLQGEPMDPETPVPETATDPPTAERAAGPSFDHDLQVVLGFELERLTVPLGELRAWREGEAVRLDRGAGDPIRLVLHQPGGSRLLGHGRVVLLDDRLGVVVESWADAPAADPSADPPGDPSGGAA